MTTEIKRDLHADLALCEAAMSGPWYAQDSAEMWQLFGGYHGAIQLIKAPKNGTSYAEYWPEKEDAKFIAESREGWPESIRRAIAAEAEVERLRDGIIRLRDRLICDLDALESGDATERAVAYADCTESTIRRLDRYVPREVTTNVD